MDTNGLSHTRWQYQYHIVFIPKYRRKVLYGKVKKDVRDIIRIWRLRQMGNGASLRFDDATQPAPSSPTHGHGQIGHGEELMLFIDWKPTTETDEIPPFGEELVRHINTYKGKVRQSSCSAWNLLYQMLIGMNIPPGHVAFSETGKPYFTDADICFSISHSKDICVAAVADRQVGVDVEMIRDNYKPHLIRRTLNEDEMDVFDGDFTRMWCRKEALVKMSGEGIQRYPFNINTTGKNFWEKQVEYNGSKYWIVSIHA